ncbi:MAG: translation initiation factor IF-3 [Leptospiraceae bacterium]|nr:translation initiation factor IF-3 [Leptospiraceae bacterium]MCB1303618.1 translation initiation factor IF-3 [Leptospiraceae bacterium]
MAKRKSHKAPVRAKEPRTNRQIRADKVRLVTEGKGIEVIDIRVALERAEAAGLDLVEVSPDQDPPVCKIIDYGKWKFEQQKKKKEQAKNQHVVSIKEIKMRPKIGDHDYDIKKRNTLSFLEKGDKVKVSLRFRGREITHPELGMKLMHRLAQDASEISQIEAPAKMEGRQIVMVLAPKAAAKRKPTGKPEGQESQKEVATRGTVEKSGPSSE